MAPSSSVDSTRAERDERSVDSVKRIRSKSSSLVVVFWCGLRVRTCTRTVRVLACLSLMADDDDDDDDSTIFHSLSQHPGMRH